MRPAFVLSLVFLVALLAVSCGQKQSEEATAENVEVVEKAYIPEYAFTSYDELLSTAKEGNKNVIIDFYTDW